MSENNSVCCICKAEVNSDDAAILTVGVAGTPRYLCDECQSAFDTVTSGKDVSEISSAMEKMGKKMADNDISDKKVLEAVDEIMKGATERADKIMKGEYDFSEDDDSQEVVEIPEELLETEEDRELDRIEAEKSEVENEFMNKITTGICIASAAAVVAFIIYKVIEIWF